MLELEEAPEYWRERGLIAVMAERWSENLHREIAAANARRRAQSAR